jgi:predicted acyltransferase
MFLPFYVICDVWGYRKLGFPLAVIGVNALAIYMAQTLIPLRRIVNIYTGGLAAAMGLYGPLFQAMTVLVVEWLILYWMYKRKIFLTA